MKQMIYILGMISAIMGFFTLVLSIKVFGVAPIFFMILPSMLFAGLALERM